jgi:DNA-directed RNA polymerase subunit omega
VSAARAANAIPLIIEETPLIYPSADTIEDRVGSRYSLVVLAAKRAKQIKEGSPVLIDTESTNPLTIAMEEIAAGKVTAQEEVAMQADAPPAAGPGRPADTRPLAVDEFDALLGGPGAAQDAPEE